MLTYLLLMVSSLVVGISRLLNGLFTFSDRTAKDLSQNNILNIGKELTIHEAPVARRRKVILLQRTPLVENVMCLLETFTELTATTV